MHTDEKMPTGSANCPAGHTDAAIVAPTCAAVGLTHKEFTMLQAACALRGHTLHRHGGADRAGGFYAVRWGMVRELHTADDARRFLLQIGGAQ